MQDLTSMIPSDFVLPSFETHQLKSRLGISSLKYYDAKFCQI